jgi:hypothetical protein
LAVAVGFEPTEACTSHAFEACSFGRSDTPPPNRIAAAWQEGSAATICEEPLEQRGAVGLAHAADDLRTVVQPPVAHDVPE